MINLHNCDCMDFMRNIPDKFYDLTIVDPPYGRKEHGGRCRSSYVRQKNGSRKFVNDGNYSSKSWDNAPVNHSYFEELFRVSKQQIVWGENYFNEQWGAGRIVWDKCNGNSDQSDCEIAFNSMNSRVDLFRFMWNGMLQGKSIYEGHIQQGNKKLNEKRIHPTQKPVALYRWLLQKYAQPGWKILDTHGGSMSLAIACHELSFELDLCEIDPEYFQAGRKRYEDYSRQLNLF